jgi:hypothetical protein
VISSEYAQTVRTAMRVRDTETTSVELTPERDPAFYEALGSPRLLPCAPLLAWHRAIQLLGRGDRFVCLDPMAMVLHPLDEILPAIQPSPAALALPQALGQTGRLHYVPTVCYGTAGPLTEVTMKRWGMESLRIAKQSDPAVTERTYGSAVSAAFTLIKSQADAEGGALLGVVPSGWVADRPPFQSAGIVTFADLPVTLISSRPWGPIISQWEQYRETYARRAGERP